MRNHIHSSVTFPLSPQILRRGLRGGKSCEYKIRIHEDLIRVNSNFHLRLDDTLAAAASGVRSGKIVSQSTGLRKHSPSPCSSVGAHTSQVKLNQALGCQVHLFSLLLNYCSDKQKQATKGDSIQMIANSS